MFYLKVLAVVFFIWIAQSLFVFQATKSGFNGWDDWGLVFAYDAFRASDLKNFPKLAEFIGTPYILSEIYNIGPLRDIFGFHQTTIKYIEILFKALAGLAAAFLVFKLTSNKLFAILTTFFFIVFPSTAGPLSHIIFIGAYLTIIFMCFSILNSKKIYLSSLFFFLAILTCPSRAYLIIPVPLFIELAHLIKSFKPSKLVKRLFIFYFPLLLFQILLLLNGDRPQQAFVPHLEMLARFKQVTSGNLYTLSLPFQAVSTLFIDLNLLQKIINGQLITGFITINLILAALSFSLGLVIKGKRFISFTFKLLGLTVLLEAIFYLIANSSLHNGYITYINYTIGDNYSQTLSPSIFQASLGGFYFILGIVLGWEWWKHQRDNKILKVIVFAWLWSVISEILLFLTTHWYTHLFQSFDRYIITCSIGAVIFSAGIFTLYIQGVVKIKSPNLKLLLFSLIGGFILLTVWENYQLLDRFYYNWNEEQGESSYWQDTMYLRFLNIFGKDNLSKSIFLYIDIGNKETAFNQGSFVYPARFRLFYNGEKLIRDDCKIVTDDIKVLKSSYKIQSGEKGFLAESICVNPNISYEFRTVFYPLTSFYAYKMKGKEFIDIKSEILSQLAQTQ